MFHVETRRRFHQEPGAARGVIRSFHRIEVMELDGTFAMEEGTMWIALFSIATATAVCLSVAAVVLQARQGDPLRG